MEYSLGRIFIHWSVRQNVIPVIFQNKTYDEHQWKTLAAKFIADSQIINRLTQILFSLKKKSFCLWKLLVNNDKNILLILWHTPY
jgi:hypothetical protein